MKKIIVFIGHNNSGKDTAADFSFTLLCDTYRVKRFALASRIKELAGQIFNIPYHVLYGPSRERDAWKYQKTDRTARDCLKSLAEAICDVDPEYHVREMLSDIETENPDIAIVSDCRKVVEAQAIRERFGDKAVFIRLWRNSEDIEWTADPHPSERDIISDQMANISPTSFYEVHNENLSKEETQDRISNILAKELALES